MSPRLPQKMQNIYSKSNKQDLENYEKLSKISEEIITWRRKKMA